MSDSFTPFTGEELDRARKSLLRRFVKSTTAKRKYGVIDVHFGTALKKVPETRVNNASPKKMSTILDAARHFAVCFVIKKKSDKDSPHPFKYSMLPKEVKIRLKRNGKLVTSVLPTDVIESPQLIASGRVIYTPKTGQPGGFDNSVTGVVVRWQALTRWGVQTHYAVMTVGHSCTDPALLGQGNIGWVVSQTTRDFPAILRVRADTASVRIDSALLIVGPADLTLEGVPINGVPPTILSREALFSDHGRLGRSARPINASGNIVFQSRTPPQTQTFVGIGVLDSVIEVRSSDANAFAPGSSGSLWEIIDDNGNYVAACIQVGTNQNDFSVGYGQVLDKTILTWAEGAINVLSYPLMTVPGSLRIASVF